MDYCLFWHLVLLQLFIMLHLITRHWQLQEVFYGRSSCYKVWLHIHRQIIYLSQALWKLIHLAHATLKRPKFLSVFFSHLISTFLSVNCLLVVEYGRTIFLLWYKLASSPQLEILVEVTWIALRTFKVLIYSLRPDVLFPLVFVH